ncbi:ester cyclase [Mucilaginibacter sp. X4EP1]|uniref:nuclear transport factor 2 family protein n=1 Tax=Mucilaginibacter sp. X4EP1 TaxID=2723092 RepID=UPI00216A2451|nr:nuclear transport factor 2 family protein [Mucilaginibacter sp. X4EP1]MCS3815751.1 putative SnoaL-like aldol condensation-catalyzing enzyme [Mucilaginibacter sp. X4EP1]
METKSNKTIVLECYRKIIRDLDLLLVDEYIREDYIQHSPTVKDGKAGLLEMLGFLKSLPQPAEHGSSPIVRVVADGDFVAAHLDIKFMGKRMAVIDLFRLQNGLIAEHWDAGQAQPEDENGLVTMTNGTSIIDEKVDGETNKALINAFYNEISERGQSVEIDRYIAKDYLDHDPDRAVLNVSDRQVKVHRIIAEGDFVVTQCEFINSSDRYAHYDIFRIEQDKIVEHWCVKQKVPLTMAHTNGMF